jgi:AbrB family transcriptional regulator (stage V sporulation protein T)
MRIREGEEMEVFASVDDSLVLKKYSPLKELKKYSDEVVEILGAESGNAVVAFDKDKIISAHGEKSTYIDKKLTFKAEKIMEGRKAVTLEGDRVIALAGEDTRGIKSMIIAPVLSGGDLFGGLAMISQKTILGDVEKRLIVLAAEFLARQI